MSNNIARNVLSSQGTME